MAQSGRIRHRDREPGLRDADEREARSPRRAFRITDAERQEIARCLRYVDEARRALQDQENPLNREIIRELKASGDRIFDVLNGLEEIED
jgi:hypothetical protein